MQISNHYEGGATKLSYKKKPFSEKENVNVGNLLGIGKPGLNFN